MANSRLCQSDGFSCESKASVFFSQQLTFAVYRRLHSIGSVISVTLVSPMSLKMGYSRNGHSCSGLVTLSIQVATLTEKPTEIIEAWCGMRDRAVVDEDDEDDEDEDEDDDDDDEDEDDDDDDEDDEDDDDDCCYKHANFLVVCSMGIVLLTLE